MLSKLSAVTGILLLALLPGVALAQSSGSSASGQPEGVTSGGYLIHQSIELGYRFTDVSGSDGMYDTLVNLQQGPRLLDQSLSMQSQDHQGLLFDDLFVNSVGWGGDPNNYLRLRVDKNKWYDFRGSFRRDQNFFDYDLLDNPLNPSTSTPNVPVTDSPHLFATTRRMTDVDLTLLPQSRLSFRLGYSHNNMTGPSFTSFHEGTDVLLFQPWNTTMDSYRMGVDWKLAPRTVLSYDQTLDYYRGDNDQQLAPFEQALLPGGAGTVELGLPINTQANQPCAVVPPATTLVDSTGTLTNIACSAYFGYLRTERVRTSTPTERVSLRSNYVRRLDLTASYSYSSADMSSPFDESFNGLVTRTFTRAYTITGPANANRVSDVLDLSATLHLTSHLRLINTFYFWAYRIPESFTSTETDWNIATTPPCAPPACSLLVPISSLTPSVTVTPSVLSFNQNWKRNQTELAWDITKKAGARIGYRYGNKDFHHVLDFSTGDVDDIVIREYTALVGLWARPVTAWRLNFDWEHSNYTDVIFRIAPRKEARYRFQTSYNPRPWALIGGSVNILEDRNDDALTNYLGHSRNYGLTASLTPRERFGMDLAYNYNDTMQNALICFNDTPPTGVDLPVVTNAGSCLVNDPNNPLLTDSFYTNHTHFGMATVMFKPVKRATTRVGYSIVSVAGSTPQFNILQPLGSLQYKYHQPLANLGVDLGHDLTWNAGWNYYQYNEPSFVGPTAPRYFHANTTTVSLRYAF